MRLNRIAFVGALTVCCGMVLAQAANVDDLIKQLGGDAPLAARSAAELESAYAAVMPKLVEKPEADDSALQKISFRAGRPGAEVERAALAKVLASQLKADAAVPLKVMLLRHIQRLGREESAAAVAALLDDKDQQVRECARRAIEANPSKPAAEALRATIDKATDPAWKAALVAALEFRRDPADAAVFAKFAADNDDAVRCVAVLALARTGDASAAPVLAAARAKGSDAAKQAASDAYLLLADRLAAANKDAAAKIYREFTGGPNPCRYAAIVGLGNAGSADDIVGMVDLLADKDTQARGVALDVLGQHKDAKVAAAILEKMKAADASAKPWFLRALAAQDGKKHVAIFAAATTDADEALRIQALKILADAGDASVLPMLLKSAQATGAEQAAARNAMEMIPGADLDKALVPLIGSGATAQRIEAIKAVGARNVKEAVPALLKATNDPEAPIRSEAHKALGLAADQSVVPQVIAAVASAKDDGERDVIGRTLAAILRKSEDENRVAPVVAAAEKSQGSTKATYYSVLGQVGGDKSLAALREAARSTDDKTREAAVRAMSTWTDATPAADLLAIARDEKKDSTAILALRGHIRMVAMGNNKKPAADQIKAYEAALAAARRPDEKRQIVGGLGDIRDAKALAALAKFLDDPQVANEACSAILKVAKDHAEKDALRAKGLMIKVLEISRNDAQKKQAQEILGRLEEWQKKNPR